MAYQFLFTLAMLEVMNKLTMITYMYILVGVLMPPPACSMCKCRCDSVVAFPY